MHPHAPIRRLLKSRSIPRIHQGLLEVSPELAVTLLEGVTVRDGRLILNRVLASGQEARPWRTYAALHLLRRAGEALAHLRDTVSTVSLRFTRPESAPLDLTPLHTLSGLHTLVLHNAAGVRALPGLKLTELSLTGVVGVSQSDVLATGATRLTLEGLALTGLPEGLTALTLHQCTGLDDFTPPTSLTSLTLTSCPDLTGLAPPTMLAHLRVHSCPRLTGLPLSAMPALTTLDAPGVTLAGSPGSAVLGVVDCTAVDDPTLLSSPVLTQARIHRWTATDLDALSGCSALEILHIAHAEELSDLSGVAGCTALRALTIGQSGISSTAPLAGLTALTTLTLQQSAQLRTLEGLGGLPTLTTLDLTGSALDNLDGLAGSTGLTHLCLTGCTGLDQIHGIRDITTLEELLLPSGRGRWSARYTEEGLTKLQERLRADVRKAEAMAAGDAMVVRLRGLLMHEDVYHQRQALEVMRSFGPEYAAGVLADCRFTEEGGVDIPFGQPSESLLTAMLDAGMLPEGQHSLSIPADRLASLSFIEHFPQLRSLHLTACIHLTTLRGLEHATNLEELVLESCPVLKDISALRGLRGLRRLVITDPNRAGTTFAPINTIMLQDALRGLVWLEELKLDRSSPVPLSVLSALPRLKVLKVPGLSPGQGFSRISGLTQLEDVEVLEARELEDLNALRGMSQLRRLVLGSSDRLRDLRPLSGLSRLEELILGGPRLADLSPLAGLTHLTVLGINEAHSIENLSPLAGLPVLRELVLSGARRVKNLRTIRGLTGLQELGLQDMGDLSTLDGLEECTTLARLDLVACHGLKSADAIIRLTSLQTLHIDRGSALGLPIQPARSETPRAVWEVRNTLYSELQHRVQVILRRLRAAESIEEADEALGLLEDTHSETLVSAVAAGLQKHDGQPEVIPLPIFEHASAWLAELSPA